MGEEGKKPEESKVEEKKPEEPKKEEVKEEAKKPEKPAEEKKPEESKDEAAPPEIVLKVFMHCEGCARKVRRSLKGFPGVEDVITDCKSHKVVVKGEKADPVKVLERVQRKSHRQVELLSPIPKPPAEDEKKPEEKEEPKPEEKKEEPQIIAVVLRVYMHCEACAQEIKKRIERMKGVESAEPDLKNSQVSVKGVFEAAKLVEHVYKRTGKQAVIVKEEPEKKEEAKEVGKDEKKGEEVGKDEKKGGGEGEGKEKKEGEGEGKGKAEEGTGEETKVVEVKKNEYQYYNNNYNYNPPRYGMEFYAYPGPAYPPQIFSDENPNACSVM
ncbi:heavy metal-associated isoprenylated plant protein 7-like [Gastrolobium bilobum]|uniref:heavy metal-associated isoprenylated plant protein 7-like n=1 Tax=Gastrolobium bilobum TaxID=150636 RepID=UPI002AB15C7D|nr:heavy metal-associated isoprenylated plant protein 7-like [Gastrolobium bilobum]